MTGYGRSEINDKNNSLFIELKSLNSRYFELNPRIPSFLTFLEDHASRQIKSECIRGRFTLSVKHEFNDGRRGIPSLNIEKINYYMELMTTLAAELNLENQLSLSDYLNLPDVLNEKHEVDEEDISELFAAGLKNAITKLNELRIQEGKNLQEDMESRLNNISEIVGEIQLSDRQSQSERFAKYKERIHALLSDIEFDDDRLYQEIAIQTEKRDITEEVVRMKSHLQLFTTYFTRDDPVGKSMNFLLQEMNREMNTIGSKSDNHVISHMVVDIKNELERIREQVQNIL